MAAISRFASLFDGLAQGFLFDPAFRDIVEQDLRDGKHRNPTRNASWFTTAYFHHADDLRRETQDAALEVVELVGVEGLAGWLVDLTDAWEDGEDREAILFAARAIEQVNRPGIRGDS